MRPGWLFLVLFWLLAGVSAARADWLWLDDSQPAALRVEANGFTLAPLLVAGETLTDGTYGNRDRILPGTTRVSFVGTFSLYYSAASTFAWTLLFLPPGGGTASAAELLMNGVPAGGGERVTGTFLGLGDPMLPETVPTAAEAVIVDPDSTFPFHTQNLSMLVSVARMHEPTGVGLLGMALAGIVAVRCRPHRRTPP